MAYGLRDIVAATSETAAFRGAVKLLEGRKRQPNTLHVLTYHRVDHLEAKPHLCPRLISAVPEQFERQMQMLADGPFQVVSIEQVLRAQQNEAPLVDGAVLITFDDAYRDFAEHAWPIMRRHGFPATVFVSTAYPDQSARSFWWDRLYFAAHNPHTTDHLNTPIGYIPTRSDAERGRAFVKLRAHIKQLPAQRAMQVVHEVCEWNSVPPADNGVLGWDQLRQLCGEGVALGAHTRSHPLLTQVSLNEAREEVLGSLHDLSREIGSAAPILAYPSGAFDHQIVEMLRKEGIHLAFTTTRGVNRIGQTDALRLRRINVGRRTTLPLLRAQLLW